MSICGRAGFRYIIFLPLVSMAAPAAWSQQGEGAEPIEEIITTGTRREGQSPTEALSPIDVLGGDMLDDQATYDLTDGLPKIAPSINTPSVLKLRCLPRSWLLLVTSLRVASAR
jgi:hypothetical protein